MYTYHSNRNEDPAFLQFYLLQFSRFITYGNAAYTRRTKRIQVDTSTREERGWQTGFKKRLTIRDKCASCVYAYARDGREESRDVQCGSLVKNAFVASETKEMPPALAPFLRLAFTNMTLLRRFLAAKRAMHI